MTAVGDNIMQCIDIYSVLVMCNLLIVPDHDMLRCGVVFYCVVGT